MTESELHRKIAQLDIERRREPRFVAEGEVVLSVMRPSGFVEVRGKLVDTSLHGLRTRHPHAGLDRGQLLLVTYPWGNGDCRSGMEHSTWKVHRDRFPASVTNF